MKVQRSLLSCPAIRATFVRSEAGTKTAAGQIVSLLRQQRTVSLTGRNVEQSGKNSQIGKTFVAKKKLPEALSAAGLSQVYFNFEEQLPLRPGAPLESLEEIRVALGESPALERLAALPDRDVYVFDEVHHIVPIDGSSSRDFYALSDSFWGLVERLFQNDKKLLFITALHPQNNFYLAARPSNGLLVFLTSPTVELLSWT